MAASSASLEEESVLECYELLSMQYIEQSENEEVWQKLIDWKSDRLSAVEVIVTLPKELWFIAVLLRENPYRLRSFLTKRTGDALEDDLLANYLRTFESLTELRLDTTFRTSLDASSTNQSATNISQNLVFRPPLAIFRCCPNVKILSLKNNNLEQLPPDIGRLSKLEKLYLTNNRLSNGSIPYTLGFCRGLTELYLDDNLLDALPSVLLNMPSLKTVHRHGNHNYFKSTFMWYHTDVTGRILRTSGLDEAEVAVERDDLHKLASKVIISSQLNFYAADIPGRLKNFISDLVNEVNICEHCSVVKSARLSGYKVFTFKNPYLGNTCVPFLHWTCDTDCARAIEVPARRAQIMDAIEQDRMYEEYVKRAVDPMPTESRSSSNISSVAVAEIEPVSACTII